MNIIKDNKIIPNITFVTRLKGFLKDVKINEAIGQVYLEHLNRIADKLLLQQVNTVIGKGYI